MKPNKKHFYVLAALIFVTIFQNCDSGFKSVEMISSPVSAGNSLISGSVPTTKTFDLSANLISTKSTWVTYGNPFPLPQSGVNFIGFSGTLSTDTIDASTPVGSEVLFSIGYVPGNCPSDGADIGSAIHSMKPLAFFMVKNFGGGHSEIPVNVSLPTSLPISGCVYVVFNGGASLQTGITSITMTSTLQLLYSDSPPSQIPSILVLADEFCFGMPGGCGLSTEQTSESFMSVASPFSTAGKIIAIYGTVSEGGLNAPNPSWKTQDAFYLIPSCSGYTPGIFGPDQYFSYLPTNAILLKNLSQEGSEATLQSLIDQSLSVSFNAGDCIIHLVNVDGGTSVDAEMEVAILIQK